MPWPRSPNDRQQPTPDALQQATTELDITEDSNKAQEHEHKHGSLQGDPEPNTAHQDSRRTRQPSPTVEPRRSNRSRRSYDEWAPERIPLMNMHVFEGKFEPRSYEAALRCDEHKLWKQAMQTEFDSLIENETWTLVELPKGNKAVKSKWIFKIKMQDGRVSRHKARLVAQGFNTTLWRGLLPSI
jgi:hypothetical protein